MDWDLKMPPWDLAELDRAAEQNIGAIVAGPSGGSALRRPPIGLDCSVDLKLGGVADSGSSYEWKDQPRLSTTSPATAPSSGPSKRHRGPGSVAQNAPCLVDGCKADLSKCREYHRRHKVCEVHSKTPVVSVGGQDQRFCQQCSRFHLLVEFDEVKRSCRKRLDGHNRRRRKPQPSSINSAGTRFLAYPQVFPATAMEPNWSRIVKAEEGIGYAPCGAPADLPFFPPNPSSRGFGKERKRFPFAQESESGHSSVTTLGSLAAGRSSHLLSSTVSGVGGGKMLSDEQLNFHSDCALSLLSSPTTQHTPDIALSSHRMAADRIPMAQPLVPSLLQYGDLAHYSHHLAAAAAAARTVSPTGYSCSVIGDGHASTTAVLLAEPADDAGMFHISGGGGGEGSSDGTSQGLPFSWQ